MPEDWRPGEQRTTNGSEGGRGGGPGHLPVSGWEGFRCRPELEAHWARQSGVFFYRHQIEAAKEILGPMGGSGILADEVGLGKTFEAGLVLKELAARGQVRRALILVPASLETQWREELARFFAITCGPGGTRQGPQCEIASLDAAKRSGRREGFFASTYDLVVVDEAHHLKNRRTQNYQFVAGLRRRHLLLLTATPIENDLNELYALVNLIKPGLYDYMAFYRQFIIDRHTAKNRTELRAFLDTIMVRRKRTEVGLTLPERKVELIPLRLSDPERALYDLVDRSVRSEYQRRRQSHRTILPLITIQRELCSSSVALLESLCRMQTDWFGSAYGTILQLARSIEENTKAEAALSFVHQMGEPVIVFTEFRATQTFLAERFRASGVPVFLFHGSLRRRERTAAIDAFRRTGGAFIATESARQGLNLQFCRTIINYDLPWNPMRVEQRIGRVHRLGQERTVFILNLFAVGTVEEYILVLLHQKIDLFRQVIGELDVILRQLEQDKPFESQLLEILMDCTDKSQVMARLDDLARGMRPEKKDAQKRDVEKETSLV